MLLHETPISNVLLIEIDPHYDERGFFASLWNDEISKQLRIEQPLSQCSLSFTRNRATIRGLHYQKPNLDSPKLIRCIRGAVFHVIVDIRPDSRTYLQTYSIALRHDKYQALLLPVGIAHGFQSLCDRCEVLYHTAPHYSHAWYGIRYDDPSLAINWPLPVSSMAKKDSQYPTWLKED